MNQSRRIDLNLLLTLDALYQTGKVSAAAELLGVSQPAVSQGLKQLRAHFHDPLFVRTRHGLSLTPHAQAMKAPLQRLLRELQDQLLTPPVFDPLLAERTFTLCLSDLAEFQWLGEFLMRFRDQAPNCRLRSMRVPVADIPGLLETGKADLAFGGLLPEMPSTLRQRRMFDYNYACLLAKDHPALASFNREAFAALPHIIVSRSGDFEDHLEKALRQMGVQRQAVISLSDNIVAAKLVSESTMIATVPSRVAQQLAEVFPLAVVDLPIRVPQVVSRMYWHERFNTDPANRWLRQLARAVVVGD